MANTIKIRRSGVQGKTPTTSDILLGELAVNHYDGKLFVKKSTSGAETGAGVSVVEIGASGGGGGSGGTYTVSATAPASPSAGDRWLDTSGIEYTYVNDGNSSAWVETGTPGASGPSGAVGPKGDRGGVIYSFSTTTTNADPGNGRLRFNNASIASVTSLIIDNTDLYGNDQTVWYSTWDDSTNSFNRGTVYISSTSSTGTTFCLFRVNGAVASAAGYYTVPVSNGTGSIPGDGENISVIFAPSGNVGIAATVAVGTTTTGNPGTSASVTNSGTSSAATLDFTIPRGDTGTAATIAVGTTTTGAAGTSASVTNSGTSSAATFNFTIPRGDTGATGATGPAAPKAVTITNPTASEKVILFFTTSSQTLTQIRSVISSGTSVDFRINYGTDASAAGTNTTTNAITCNSTTTGVSTTSFSSATIPANNFVWITTSAVSGTVGALHVSLIY